MVVVKPNDLERQGEDNLAREVDDFETIHFEEPNANQTNARTTNQRQFSENGDSTERSSDNHAEMETVDMEGVEENNWVPGDEQTEKAPRTPDINQNFAGVPDGQPTAIPGAVQFQQQGVGQPTVIIVDQPPEKVKYEKSTQQKIFIRLYFILMGQFGFMAGFTATLLFVEPIRQFLKVNYVGTIAMDVFLYIFCSIYYCAVFGCCAKCCACAKSRSSIIVANIAVTIILGTAMAFTAATLVAEAFLIFNMMMMIYYLIVALYVQFSNSAYQANPTGYAILIPLVLLLTGGSVGITYAAHSGNLEDKDNVISGLLNSNKEDLNMTWEIAKAIIAGVLFLIVGIFVLRYTLYIVTSNDLDDEDKAVYEALLERPEFAVFLSTNTFVLVIVVIWIVLKKILKRLRLCKSCLG